MILDLAEKLKAIPEGDGNLLDNTILCYMPGMGHGDAHEGVGVVDLATDGLEGFEGEGSVGGVGEVGDGLFVEGVAGAACGGEEKVLSFDLFIRDGSKSAVDFVGCVIVQ